MKGTLLVWCLVLGTVYSTSTYSSLGKELIDIGKDLKRSLSPLKSQARFLLNDFKSLPNNGGKNSKSRAKLNSISEEGAKFFASARRAIDGYAFRLLGAALRAYDDRDGRQRKMLADKQKRSSSKQSRGIIANGTEIITDYVVNVLYCTLDKTFKTDTTLIISHNPKTTTPAGGGGDETTTPAGGGGDETTTPAGGGGDETTSPAGGGGDETTTPAGGGGDDGNGGGDDGNGGGDDGNSGGDDGNSGMDGGNGGMDGGNSGGVGGNGGMDGGNGGMDGGNSGGEGGNGGGNTGEVGTSNGGDGETDGGDPSDIFTFPDGEGGTIGKKRKHNKNQKKISKKHHKESHKTNHH